MGIFARLAEEKRKLKDRREVVRQERYEADLKQLKQLRVERRQAEERAGLKRKIQAEKKALSKARNPGLSRLFANASKKLEQRKGAAPSFIKNDNNGVFVSGSKSPAWMQQSKTKKPYWMQ